MTISLQAKKKILAGILPVLLMSCLVPPAQNAGEEQNDEPPLFSAEFSSDYAIPADFDFEGEIARWYGFREAAASITFDDGTYDQYSTAWPVLEEKGIKGTFYLAAGLIGTGDWDDHGTVRRMMNWEQASQIAASGHEIGSHSLNHVDVTAPGVDLDAELRESRKLIESQIPDVSVETFCWPHWRETDKTVEAAEEEYLSARSGNGIISYYYSRKGGIPSDPPENMYAVNALGILNSHSDSDWQKVAEDVYREKSWFVTSFHGVEPADGPTEGTGWSPLSRDVFSSAVDYLIDRGFWIDTFAAVSKYIYERDASLLHLANGGTSLRLTLDNSLDKGIYDRELTVSLNLPPGWETASAYGPGGDRVLSRIDSGKIIIDIVPDGQSVFIKPY